MTGIWIGPIWKQVAKLDTYHGYGVQNFLDVEPRFGTKEELRDLVSEAHSKGMVVVLDIILYVQSKKKSERHEIRTRKANSEQKSLWECLAICF